MTDQPVPISLNPKQVFELYGIQPFTIRKMVREGRIKGRTGKPFLVDAESLRQWYESGITNAAA